MKLKEESEKLAQNSTFKKLRSFSPSPITSWQLDGETMETMTDFNFLGSKITADGDCSVRLKDAFSLEERL